MDTFACKPIVFKNGSFRPAKAAVGSGRFEVPSSVSRCAADDFPVVTG